MLNSEIGIRDPFVVAENGKYYLIGTRNAKFGQNTNGFDIYVGTDLEHWSDPIEVFCSETYGMNKGANWAPEIHKYKGRYYIFATFEQPNGFRGTYSLVSDSITGPYVPCSDKALTPVEWWSLDGTLFVDENDVPYLVFCHEHVQILNGTICYIQLNEELSAAVGEPQYMFSGSDANGAVKSDDGRYVTDGPFIYRGKNNRLYMIWSSIINHQYFQCLAYSENGRIDGNWIQAEPIFKKDGGHGMLFRDNNNRLMLTLHCPNVQPLERPAFFELHDDGNALNII